MHFDMGVLALKYTLKERQPRVCRDRRYLHLLLLGAALREFPIGASLKSGHSNWMCF